MILVTGASGTVGRHVTARLSALGQKVRAISRAPERAGLPGGVEVLRADLARPETLPAALDGVETAFLFPAHGQLEGFLTAARHAGVRRIVLLSSSAPGYDKPNPIIDAHRADERVVAGSGLAWTFVRPSGFMANDLQWAATIKSAGVVRAPYGRAAFAPVDERDVAAVAVAALTDDTHAGEAYELTGPAALSTIDRVRILGETIGQTVRFEETTPQRYREQMAGRIPADYIEAMLNFGAHFDCTPAPVLPTVEQVTGHPAHTYAQWAAYHAADFLNDQGHYR